MRFRFINDLNLGIHNLNLEVLEKNTDPYSTLLFQPIGVFSGTEQKFGNNSNERDKFLDFLRLANVENVALALTPEYSCPWEVIEQIAADVNNRPANRKLWILGCESISPDELQNFVQNFQSENLIIHFEAEVLNNDGNFLDPICYVFNIETENNENKCLLLIQFKTQHMGVRTTVLENENYIPGETIYILRNSNISIQLFTLICSEAERFIPHLSLQIRNEINWDNNPYLIIHLQLNPKPKDYIFTSFRYQALSPYDKKEIISLNWSSLSKIVAIPNPKDFMSYSRSAFYAKKIEVDNTNDTRITENHQRGMFICTLPPFTYAFYLTRNKEVFKISAHKVDQSGFAIAMQRRSTPRILSTYKWENNHFIEIIQEDDGFCAYLDTNGCVSGFLRSNAINVFDKERIVNLSRATIKIKEQTPWYFVEMLQSLQIDELETISRLTFFQDNDALSRNFRDQYRNTINYLNNTIITNPVYFPPNISFMGNRCDEIKFDYTNHQEIYNYNLITTDGEHKATVAYLGDVEIEVIEQAFKNLLNLFLLDDNSKKKITVWYSRGANVQARYLEQPPRQSDETQSDKDSITNLER